MLNPLTYTHAVVADFLRYQLTAYPLADASLHAQMRELLRIEHMAHTPLLKGPYVSLARPFASGASFSELAAEGVIHKALPDLVDYPAAYGHQEAAFRSIAAGRHTLVATGTGSGKTECFLYPIVSRCLELNEEGTPEGIRAVIIYPMNALAEDQLERTRKLLAGTGISFGMYVGRTPEEESAVTGRRLKVGASNEEYLAAIAEMTRSRKSQAVHPQEERPSREELRRNPPRILLTNVKQLELLLTRQRDVELFDNAELEFLVFDEAHTFRGAAGAETACLTRRLRAFRGSERTVCIATSATITDPDTGESAGADFARRFFGVDPASVTLVTEDYRPDSVWADQPIATRPPADPVAALARTLRALSTLEDHEDAASEDSLSEIVAALTGERLDRSGWRANLFERLAGTDIVPILAAVLEAALPLDALVHQVGRQIGRDVTPEEVLLWLALGAAARDDDRPLLRPIVHVFVRGIDGAVVTFPSDGDDSGGRLALSAGQSADRDSDLRPLPILTCTTCGQHYFEHYVSDFTFTGKRPEGGNISGAQDGMRANVVWPSQEIADDGSRVILLDKLAGIDAGDDDTDDDDSGQSGDDLRREAELARAAFWVHFCRHCGALHRHHDGHCRECGRAGALVPLWVVRQRKDHPGLLTRCLACGSPGRQIGFYREPIRRVRAYAVSDVHILAQSLIQHAERRRLLIFTDNRQDAAFQAGWMRDRARRFRLRSLMHTRLSESPVSVDALTEWLDGLLESDPELSRALLREVWELADYDENPGLHRQERRHYLRLQVLREITPGSLHRLGLEPWGRLRVAYVGLDAEHPFFEKWSDTLGTSPTQLAEGVAALLDVLRRRQLLWDADTRAFSRKWKDGDREIQSGYIPLFRGVPKGMALTRGPGDAPERVQAWRSNGHLTLASYVAGLWGVMPGQGPRFLDQLWAYLTDQTKLLTPVTFVGSGDKPIVGADGAYQIDADSLVLESHRGTYRCDRCRKVVIREGISGVCLAWRCGGRLVFEAEDPDNFDLAMLDSEFAMVRPREHSGQVPGGIREEVERLFKSGAEEVNTLVATPTLELGVDIGSLDAVLLRNVPPTPANYWQRVGRAGRQHRMALDLTYARPASHDRAYFADPLKMLDGRIDPPRFNLKNRQMVAKHVHAVVMTTLYQLARSDSDLSGAERIRLISALNRSFPDRVRDWVLRGDGNLRERPFDADLLRVAIDSHREAIVANVQSAFGYWPEEDADAAPSAVLECLVSSMPSALETIVGRVRHRVEHATEQLARLERREAQGSRLDPEERALQRTYRALLGRIRGTQRRQAREAEGYDDVYTYGLLAAEGFLPGYGLSSGTVVAEHMPPTTGDFFEGWEVRREPATALREYAPGSLVYANGHKFAASIYEVEANSVTAFHVDVAHEAVVEAGAEPSEGWSTMGQTLMMAIPISDVKLRPASQISDEEDYRFRMDVTVFGLGRDRHGSGMNYGWGPKSLLHVREQHLRLVNVGPAREVEADSSRLGYPICTICGGSVSPFANEATHEKFKENHSATCGTHATHVGLFADLAADVLRLRECADSKEAYSVAEALRMGAASVLEMEIDDLQLLKLGTAGVESTDMLIYDPMAGGSGLLDQMVERWDEVVAAGLELVEGCPAVCEQACVDCLMTYRNSWYHRHLDRHVAAERLRAWGDRVTPRNPIPARLPAERGDGLPVNIPEKALETMLKEAGLGTPEAQVEIPLNPSTSTVPDFFYPKGMKGICIYLDGMTYHGTAAARQRDNYLRGLLRERGYEVVSIASIDLYDAKQMGRHLATVGRYLVGSERGRELRDGGVWYDAGRQWLDSEEGGKRAERRGGEAPGRGGLDDGEGGIGTDTPLDCHERYLAASEGGYEWDPWAGLDADGARDRLKAERSDPGATSSAGDARGVDDAVLEEASKIAWDSLLPLLDPRWLPLARGLRDLGVPEPDDAHADIMDRGRVSGQRAVLVWGSEPRAVRLVEPRDGGWSRSGEPGDGPTADSSETADQAAASASSPELAVDRERGWVIAGPNAAPGNVAEVLTRLLSEGHLTNDRV